MPQVLRGLRLLLQHAAGRRRVRAQLVLMRVLRMDRVARALARTSHGFSQATACSWIRALRLLHAPPDFAWRSPVEVDLSFFAVRLPAQLAQSARQILQEYRRFRSAVDRSRRTLSHAQWKVSRSCLEPARLPEKIVRHHRVLLRQLQSIDQLQFVIGCSRRSSQRSRFAAV